MNTIPETELVEMLKRVHELRHTGTLERVTATREVIDSVPKLIAAYRELVKERDEFFKQYSDESIQPWEREVEKAWHEQRGVNPITGRMWLTPRMERVGMRVTGQLREQAITTLREKLTALQHHLAMVEQQRDEYIKEIASLRKQLGNDSI